MGSINTNFGATIALQSLNRTTRQLDAVQKRVSTGFRVADAKDDGAAFAVAQGLRADVKGIEAVQERLSVAKGLLAVTQEGLKGVSDTIGSLRSVLVKLVDAVPGSQEIQQYRREYAALIDNMYKYIDQATFGGKSLLGTGAADINVISDAGGGTITLSAIDMKARIVTLGVDITPTTSSWSVIKIAAVEDLERSVGTQLSALGANNRTIENQDRFMGIMSDGISNATGSIVDADLAKDSATLQALQIRQQLGVQALSIANQAPNMLISLFQ
jgi:flagellin